MTEDRKGAPLDWNGPRALRFKDVEKITGLSRATLYRRIDSGELPVPSKLGKNSHAVGFPADAVERFVRDSLGLNPADLMPAA